MKPNRVGCREWKIFVPGPCVCTWAPYLIKLALCLIPPPWIKSVVSVLKLFAVLLSSGSSQKSFEVCLVPGIPILWQHLSFIDSLLFGALIQVQSWNPRTRHLSMISSCVLSNERYNWEINSSLSTRIQILHFDPSSKAR